MKNVHTCVMSAATFLLLSVNAEVSALPSRYTPIDYITATGSQYIDTGYVPACSDRVEIGFTLNSAGQAEDGSGTWKDQAIFGSEYSNKSQLMCVFLNASVDGVFMYNRNVDSTATKGVCRAESGRAYDMVVDYGKFTCTVNGKMDAIMSDQADFTPQYRMLIFHVQNKNNVSYGWGVYSLRYFRIYDSTGELKFNGVPAIDCEAESDAVAVGLYDTVSGAFKTNAGSGILYGGGKATVSTVTELRTAVADIRVGQIELGAGNFDLSSDGLGGLVFSRPIALRGAGRDLSFVDGGNSFRGLSFEHGASGSQVESLTVRNCRATTGNAAGICSENADMRVVDCHVSDCVVEKSIAEETYGGGICLKSGGIAEYRVRSNVSSTLVERCMISIPSANVATKKELGGGIYAVGSRLEDCVISCCTNFNTKANNTMGGGVYAEGCTLLGCSVVSNSTVAKGVLFLDSSAATNCLVAFNSNPTVENAGICSGAGASEMFACSVVSNVASKYAAVTAGVGGLVLRKTLVQGNVAANTPAMCTGLVSLYDCILKDNAVSGTGLSSVRLWYPSVGSTFDGCVFDVSPDSGTLNVLEIPAGSGGLRVSRSIFTGGNANVSFVTIGAPNGACDVDIRNCFFGSCACPLTVNLTTAGDVRVDNCTFGGDFKQTFNEKATTARDYYSYYAQHFFVRNCVFPKATASTFMGYSGNYENFARAVLPNFTNCAFLPGILTEASGAFAELGNGHANVFSALADMKFSDSAGGDWSYSGGSTLRGAGAVLDWMDASTLAISGGTYESARVMDWGCEPVFPQCARRLSKNQTVDIGCFQFYAKPGLILLLR